MMGKLIQRYLTIAELPEAQAVDSACGSSNFSSLDILLTDTGGV
jgi:hypothetical protein